VREYAPAVSADIDKPAVPGTRRDVLLSWTFSPGDPDTLRVTVPPKPYPPTEEILRGTLPPTPVFSATDVALGMIAKSWTVKIAKVE
jgi:hypothetical protein